MFTDTEFYEAVYIHGPLRFDGYRFLEFYRAKMNLHEGAEGFVHDFCSRSQRDFKLPEDANLSMAVCFFFQRGHKNYGFPNGPDAPEDGKWFGSEGVWSHFYLLYLHLYRHTIPSYFGRPDSLPAWSTMLGDGTADAVATRTRQELVGYRGSEPLELRCVNADELQNLATQASEKYWLKKLTDGNPQLLDRPDVILALSFKANGFTRMMTANPDPLWHPQSHESSCLAERTMKMLSSEFAFSAENDENRAVMFLLELWLLDHPDKADYKSREHLLFCLLYLHLYRQPLSAYFTRSAFGKRWQQFSFDAKETVAANMRRNLARIRNEAAKAHPCERTMDKST